MPIVATAEREMFERILDKNKKPPQTSNYQFQRTGTKVHHDIDEEDSVAHAIEGNPSGTQIIVEKRYGYRQNDQIGHQEQQHA